MSIAMKVENRSRAYWCGWFDGRRYGSTRCFTENPRLAEWTKTADRLDYYRGHRAGNASRRHSGGFLEAS
jgi:hypothetical protein